MTYFRFQGYPWLSAHYIGSRNSNTITLKTHDSAMYIHFRNYAIIYAFQQTANSKTGAFEIIPLMELILLIEESEKLSKNIIENILLN